MTADGVASRQMASRLTNSSNIESFIPHYMDILKGMFAFAYVWGFGGHLHDRSVLHPHCFPQPHHPPTTHSASLIPLTHPPPTVLPSPPPHPHTTHSASLIPLTHPVLPHNPQRFLYPPCPPTTHSASLIPLTHPPPTVLSSAPSPTHHPQCFPHPPHPPTTHSAFLSPLTHPPPTVLPSSPSPTHHPQCFPHPPHPPTTHSASLIPLTHPPPTVLSSAPSPTHHPQCFPRPSPPKASYTHSPQPPCPPTTHSASLGPPHPKQATPTVLSPLAHPPPTVLPSALPTQSTLHPQSSAPLPKASRGRGINRVLTVFKSSWEMICLFQHLESLCEKWKIQLQVFESLWILTFCQTGKPTVLWLSQNSQSIVSYLDW